MYLITSYKLINFKYSSILMSLQKADSGFFRLLCYFFVTWCKDITFITFLAQNTEKIVNLVDIRLSLTKPMSLIQQLFSVKRHVGVV